MSNWNHGQPPRRGPYWTRSDPAAAKSANAGWRWWFGDQWSNARRKRAHVLALASGQDINRNTPLVHAIQWRTKKVMPR